MSPALKSKSKDKASGKAAKEQQKASSKPSSALANGANIPASAYNPASGTFHALEAAPSSSSPLPRTNAWFGNGDETEEQSVSSLGTAADYDSDSNSSGESDDPKEKATSSTAPKSETIPGSYTDKRDKIRQKNERKHQRQREKRAQELHEKCSGYLMSRKLEALSQQLVSMGFPAERATMALILNEGRVEDSVSWLLNEGSTEGKQLNTTNLDTGCNLKLDILEELSRITEIELKFKCSKQEVERAIVSCEGDLEKAVETLKAQKQEAPPAPPRIENPSDQVLASRTNNKVTSSTQSPVTRLQVKPSASVSIQQSREEKDINHPKVVLAGATLPPNGRSAAETLRGMQAKIMEGRWPNSSPNPSVSHPLASPLQAAVLSAKAEAHYGVVANEAKSTLKAGTLREPVIMMQRPQSVNLKHNMLSASVGVSTSPPVSAGWYPNGASSLDMIRSIEQNMGRMGVSTRSYSPSQPFYHQTSVPSLMDNGGSAFWDGPAGSWGSSGSHSFGSPASDWHTNGSIPQFDYTSIDWSHDIAPMRRNSVASLKTDRLNETWSTAFMGAKLAKKPMLSVGIPGFQDNGHVLNSASSVGSSEWTSPFQGNDLLRVPRQSVTSPTLHERGF